jgi:hypothetical protein
MAFRTSRTFDVIFLALLGLFLWWAAANRVAIGDWIYFLRYQPSPDIVKLADEAGLSDYRRHLFYRTNPQITDAAGVAAHCDAERLGCLTSSGEAYILNDPTKPTETIVTAAHETLHLAYRRLSDAQKQALAPTIDEAITDNNGPTLSDELRDETAPQDRRDEAHSLLGTEYPTLPSQLAQYYKQYFSDRGLVLTAAANE